MRAIRARPLLARPLPLQERMWASHAPGGFSWTRPQTVWVALSVGVISLFVPAKPGGVVPPRDPSGDPRPPGTWTLYDDELEANAAAAADFELLPGIGPGIARRLVEARDARGGWCSLEEAEAAAKLGARWGAAAARLSVRPARRCSSSSSSG